MNQQSHGQHKAAHPHPGQTTGPASSGKPASTEGPKPAGSRLTAKKNETVLGPFTIRDLAVFGSTLILFVGSLIPMFASRYNLWNLGSLFFLGLGILLPLIVTALFVARRLTPASKLRIGSLSIDQFASVVASFALAFFFLAGAETYEPAVLVSLIGSLGLLAATVLARFIPFLAGDFLDRAEAPAHVVARESAVPFRKPSAPKEPKPAKEPGSGTLASWGKRLTSGSAARGAGTAAGGTAAGASLNGDRTHAGASAGAAQHGEPRYGVVQQGPAQQASGQYGSGQQSWAQPDSAHGHATPQADATLAAPAPAAGSGTAAAGAAAAGAAGAPAAARAAEATRDTHPSPATQAADVVPSAAEQTQAAAVAPSASGATQATDVPAAAASHGNASGPATGAMPAASAPAETMLHPQVTSQEPIGATVDPSSRPEEHEEQPVHEAFWFAVAQPRTAVDERTGTPAFVIEPGGWVLALEDRGHEFLVQHTDGRVGVLRDLSNIERG
jgi:hypothetical protein